MKLSLAIPIIIKNVKIFGPKGNIKVDMLLDTGAAFTAISWSILKAIGYDPAITPDRQTIITANGIIEVPKLQIKRITFGDIDASKIDIIAHDIPELAEVRGLLGLSFLKHFRTVIDYKTGELEIS